MEEQAEEVTDIDEKKKKKGKGAVKAPPGCPTCYQPLSLTLGNLRCVCMYYDIMII